MADLSYAKVSSKARMAMKRREDDIEEEEIQGGEINLIPYLDIVTNLMLFLLASVSAGLVLGQLNTTLPDQGPSQASMANKDPNKDPDEQPLKLVVSVAKDEIIVWSISKLEGTIQEPKVRIGRAGANGTPCITAITCESSFCGLASKTCEPNPNPESKPIPVFDYQALNDALFEIADRRYKGKRRASATYQSILMADGSIPYGTIIAIMDAMRCRWTVETGGSSCALPSEDEEFKKQKLAVSADGKFYDTALVDYDPTKMALFHDILFSTGFE